MSCSNLIQAKCHFWLERRPACVCCFDAHTFVSCLPSKCNLTPTTAVLLCHNLNTIHATTASILCSTALSPPEEPQCEKFKAETPSSMRSPPDNPTATWLQARLGAQIWGRAGLKPRPDMVAKVREGSEWEHWQIRGTLRSGEDTQPDSSVELPRKFTLKAPECGWGRKSLVIMSQSSRPKHIHLYVCYTLTAAEQQPHTDAANGLDREATAAL